MKTDCELTDGAGVFEDQDADEKKPAKTEGRRMPKSNNRDPREFCPHCGASWCRYLAVHGVTME